ncbi:aminotransferase class I/II-fold pyridoxal phosphate-dependent enzyme [Paenibacillus sp. J2TS4]|uniref:aminotransferase class I/II-fold pyridoxal phosphate-dependent enzyme n=1 Tax=Paenibacillus sp. J2TS4 TaxID=2807194 RepID=UPI001B07EF77|nr:aminotransferase class I/II-fold pyridoxal phosphate-dependent enzyme [Paenibacillus sp. J2TS4]GIP31896.1 aminotransferase [Paenibacillus sp. J2TS4]
MASIHTLSTAQLKERRQKLQEQYNRFKSQKLRLDMSRGKPCPEQLDLANGMLELIRPEDGFQAKNGMDTRNYGGLDGIPEAKELFAPMLEVSTRELIIGGNSSLSMMHDTIARAMFHGVYGSLIPWGKLPVVKFIAPTPGYDRHFAICELFHIEMITVDMLDDGPDMEIVEKLVREDEAIKGIWCVPKYSNPQGITYSDEVVDRLASMPTKAEDFRIFWDDAYAVHHLTEEPDSLKNILAACKEAGNPNRVFQFSSTSKISFSGAGVAMMAASESNVDFILKQLSVQTIGPDKINQLRHVRFFKSMDGIQEHMRKHAAIIRPKFERVLSILEAELGDRQMASWSQPNGGYFISLNTMDGCAKAVVEMAAEAGVVLTKAGATYPYGIDPRDRNIRLAPTYPSLEELTTAIEVLCLCVQIVGINKLLSDKEEYSA